MRTILSIIRRGELVCVFLIIAVLAGARLPIPAHAQTDDTPTAFGYPAVDAYTLDHPIDPALLILATPDGRYSISPLDGCDQFGSGDEVLFYSDANGGLFMFMPKLSPHDTRPVANCHIQIVAQVDANPCLENPYGNCDVSLEQQ